MTIEKMVADVDGQVQLHIAEVMFVTWPYWRKSATQIAAK